MLTLSFLLFSCLSLISCEFRQLQGHWQQCSSLILFRIAFNCFSCSFRVYSGLFPQHLGRFVICSIYFHHCFFLILSQFFQSFVDLLLLKWFKVHAYVPQRPFCMSNYSLFLGFIPFRTTILLIFSFYISFYTLNKRKTIIFRGDFPLFLVKQGLFFSLFPYSGNIFFKSTKKMKDFPLSRNIFHLLTSERSFFSLCFKGFPPFQSISWIVNK